GNAGRRVDLPRVVRWCGRRHLAGGSPPRSALVRGRGAFGGHRHRLLPPERGSHRRVPPPALWGRGEREAGEAALARWLGRGAHRVWNDRGRVLPGLRPMSPGTPNQTLHLNGEACKLSGTCNSLGPRRRVSLLVPPTLLHLAGAI